MYYISILECVSFLSVNFNAKLTVLVVTKSYGHSNFTIKKNINTDQGNQKYALNW